MIINWEEEYKSLVRTIGSVTYGKERWFHVGNGLWLDRKEDDWIDFLTLEERVMSEIEDVDDYSKYVPRSVYEQMVGERDIAISQLEDLGIAFGQNPRLVAIPRDWLEKWFKERYKSKTYEHLIEDWEKQNEIHSNS